MNFISRLDVLRLRLAMFKWYEFCTNGWRIRTNLMKWQGKKTFCQIPVLGCLMSVSNNLCALSANSILHCFEYDSFKSFHRKSKSYCMRLVIGSLIKWWCTWTLWMAWTLLLKWIHSLAFVSWLQVENLECQVIIRKSDKVSCLEISMLSFP